MDIAGAQAVNSTTSSSTRATPSGSTAASSRPSTSMTAGACGRADVAAASSSCCCPSRTCCSCCRRKASLRWSARRPTVQGNRESARDRGQDLEPSRAGARRAAGPKRRGDGRVPDAARGAVTRRPSVGRLQIGVGSWARKRLPRSTPVAQLEPRSSSAPRDVKVVFRPWGKSVTPVSSAAFRFPEAS